MRSKNKGADQLRDYSAATFCLCFRIYKKQVSHDAAQNYNIAGKLLLILRKMHECLHRKDIHYNLFPFSRTIHFSDYS